MAGNSKPNINVTRIKMSMPQGYMLGRTSPGVGPLELVPIAGGSGNGLGSHLVASGVVSGPVVTVSAMICELAFNIGGGASVPALAANQYYYAAISPAKATFPTTNLIAADKAKCYIAPTTTVVFYLVTAIASYAASGYSAGVAATITFTSGQTTGTIVWLVNPTTINQNDVLFLVVSPAFTDTAIEGVSIVLVGDYVSG